MAAAMASETPEESAAGEAESGEGTSGSGDEFGRETSARILTYYLLLSNFLPFGGGTSAGTVTRY